jgi:hypothetical protein
MKTKINILYLVLLVGLFFSPVFGQTSVFKINVVSPPSSLPACKTRLKTTDSNGQQTTIFSVLIPRNLELDLDGSITGYTTENNYYIFRFEADSGTCQTTASGYEIKLSGAVQTSSAINTAQPTPTATPVATSVPASTVPLDTQIDTAKKEAEDEQELDFSIPESPGFTILGLNPQEVTRPATPREFATALINSIDRNGNFQTGIAIDVAPFQLLLDVNRDEDYIDFQEKDEAGKVREAKDKKREPLKHYFTRFLWRTQFSLATTKGTTEDDKSARLGTGLNLTFFDFGDPNTDFFLRECNKNTDIELEKQAIKDLGLNPDRKWNRTQVESFRARQSFLISQDFFGKKYEKCSEESEKRNFGRSSFGVGVAGSWISTTGESSKFTNNGQAIWTSLNYGFEGTRLRCDETKIIEGNRCITPQLIFHFRRRVKENVPNPLVEGMFTNKDSNLFGTRLRLGVPKWAVNLEGVYRGERYAGRTSSNSIEASFGADYRLAKNLYLNFSVGGATKESNIPNTGKVFVRTSFNWGTSQKPLN